MNYYLQAQLLSEGFKPGQLNENKDATDAKQKLLRKGARQKLADAKNKDTARVKTGKQTKEECLEGVSYFEY